MIAAIISVLLPALSVFVYSRHKRFGKSSSGERLKKIQRSQHFSNGQFQNLSYTPPLSNGYSYADVFYKFFFKQPKDRNPSGPIPSIKTDLKSLPATEDVLIWFGHSSYYFQLNGIRFLVDPVLSGNASPVYNTNKAFNGTNEYSAEDLPPIDYLLITHDHYDHLDYATIKKLRHKIKKVVCPLGVGAHLQHWEFDINTIYELDWYETISPENGLRIDVCPARHFSGRTFKRNGTLWCAYSVQVRDFKMFVGGDSGYGEHFKIIGEKFGSFDLAVLENGQYNEAWREIHALPDETIQIAKHLDAKRVLSVHSSKFALALHSWREPLDKITALADAQNVKLITPLIGEKVWLKDPTQQFSQWWSTIK